MESARRTAGTRAAGGRRRRSGASLLPQVLTAAVESAPDTVALRFNPTGAPADQRELTYRELDESSSRLARELIARGLGPGDYIAMGIARSIESVTALWAVAKTGATYVPVDPAYPADRIAHILTDSGTRVGLTTSTHRDALDAGAAGEGVEWIELDDPDQLAGIGAHPAHPISYADRVRPLTADHPAWIIYTSGSTGKPKGVLVSHHGLGPVVAAGARLGVGLGSTITHLSSPSFDFSLMEMLFAFPRGATMVIAPPMIFGGAEMAELLRREQVTDLMMTPGALESVDPAGLDRIRTVVAAGEKVSAELVNRWASPGRTVHNFYGPTETTVIVTGTELRPDEPITIGPAFPGVGAYVLDPMLRPVPAGVVGELYLSGPSLAYGYRNRQDLTAERFVANPFVAESDGASPRMYRTGDLVRRRESDGAFEYMGRSDFQVKIRGLRIELGEIDNALLAHPDIDYAATLGVTLPSGATTLVAYVLSRKGAGLDTAEVAEFVGKSVPAYMVPSAIMVLDELPLTPVGKLDRAALPAPVFAGKAFRAPSDRFEQIVADVFAALLIPDAGPDERVGADDDFFALGGNSLMATQAVARIAAELDTRVPLPLLFECPTVADLAARLREQAGGAARPPLRAMTRPDRIPLSYAQQRMWFLNRFDTDSGVNNIPVAVRLSGSLDVAALRAAVGDLLARHEVLRTVYPEVDGEGTQVVLPIEDQRAVPAMDLAPATEDDLVAQVVALAMDGFDVTLAPPIRLRLFALAPEEHVLVCVVHHIAADGFSMGPLTRDLMSAYSVRATGAEPAWEPLPVQYADFTLWQRATLGAESDPESTLAQQVSFWRAQLAGLPEQLDLPADRPRPAVMSNRSAGYSFALDAQLHNALSTLAKQHNSTLFFVMHAAMAVLLARLSGTTDIAVGTPVAGRGDEALDDVVGMFVNTLVLRSEVDPDESFAELLAEVRRTDVAAFAHADLPFERLVELLDPARSMARHPLFQVMLTFQNMSHTELRLPGLTASALELGAPPAKFDLELTLVPHEIDGAPAGLAATFIYATDLFDESTMAAFAERLRRILTAVVADPQRSVGGIELLERWEQQRILRDWNDTAHPLAPELLHDAYRRAVVEHADAVAVAYEGAELTYREFDERVNRLARLLISQGVGPESLVGLAIRRSLDLVVGMYAIVTAGGAYVPLDPDHPAERIAHILDTAQPVCVLSTLADSDAVPAGVDVLRVDTVDLSGVSGAPVEATELLRPLRRDNPAYVIFTSGSTGRPKGVAISHGAIDNQTAWMLSEYPMGPGDVYLQKTATTFDVSLWGYFMPLRTGAKLVVATHDGHRDPAYIAETIAAQRVTVTDFVPSMLTVFATHTAPGSVPTLRDVFVIGEALPPETVAEVRAMSGAAVHNLYGPTEAAVSVTYWPATEADTTTVPIGLPQWNTRVYVLDSRLRAVPAGVVGELYLAGDQLARGYVARPDLTSDRFVANPFEPGARMYRTGDLVVWRDQPHRLEYLGRTDFQVKFRGQRIELGEIETALLAHPSISQAVALVVPTATGDQLVGYVVARPGETVDIDDLLDAAAKSLPAYMIPGAVMVLDAFPLNTSGKLDRKALPEPTFRTRQFRAPSTPIEEIIAGVYAELLGLDRVGADDDYFALGGNSLLATRAVARLNETLETAVSVRDLFEAPTVSALAARVVPGAGGVVRPPLVKRPRPEHVPLSLAQQRMWVLNQLDPASAAYNLPFAIRLSGELDTEALRLAVEDVLVRHEALRTRFPVTAPGEQPYQQVLPVVEVLPHGLEVETPADPAARIGELLSAGFDVTEAAPLRIRLLSGGPNSREHVLVLVVHHICADGISLSPLARDLVTAYLARSGGEAPGWAPLPVQYADFALWQRDVVGTDEDPDSPAARQLAYWREQLAGLTGALDLPLDHPRPPVPSERGATVGIEVEPDVHAGLVRLAHAHRASLFMVVHAALAVLLARMSGSSDIAVGTPIAGRGERALDELVGMFVNTLTLRTEVDRAEGFQALLERARETDLAAFAHADIPFERVSEVVQQANRDQSPLFQVVIAFEDYAPPSAQLHGLAVSLLDSDQVSAKFDLQLIVQPRLNEDGTPGPLGVLFTYATDLFDEATIAALTRRFERILRAVHADADAIVGDIDILEPEEHGLVAGAALDADHADDDEFVTTGGTELPQLLTAVVEDDPDAPAVVGGDVEISYRELDAESSRLARVLIGRGIGPESTVALAADRGTEFVVAVWAVLKTGAALAPVTQAHPEPADGTPADLGLVVGSYAEFSGEQWLRLDTPQAQAQIAAESNRPVTYANRVRVLRGEHPALVPSSGETIDYDGLAAASDRLQARTKLTFESRTFRYGPASSGAAILEVVAAGAAGATLVLAALGGPETSPAERAEALAEEWVTHLLTDREGPAAIDLTAPSELRVVVLDGHDRTMEAGDAEGLEVFAVADFLKPARR
ncbi:amino acid adenylation domain-containing protein [Nocardia higoensis]|uniref:Amino acid adenylation domain-containing protein n=1 Tax=Nocardia higoensis TaxID=228599 RepID=A0ABS0DCB7_9NOCA|nr:amino acid adenylation domain-containing protein [Nocardia higoensis]